jgi:phytoene synthase
MTDHPHHHDETGELDEAVRQADPDRWLASRFIADPTARAEVVALYAFNHELARATEVARDALLGEIRLTWWREAFEEVAAGKAHRRHPVVDVLAHSGFDPNDLAALAEARMADLDPAPFENEAAALEYIDATAGAIMALAAGRLHPDASSGQTRQAARAWALAGLWRAAKATGRVRLPAEWSGTGVRARVGAALAAANRDGKGLPAEAFPAVAYACLAGRYAAGAQMGELERKARLIWVVARGKV